MVVEPTAVDEQPLRSLVAAQTALTRGLAYAIGFVASVMIARALGPAGRGQYVVVVTAASTCMAVGHLSIEQANLFLWAERGERSRLIGSAVAVGLAAGLASAVLAGFLVVQGWWLSESDPLLIGLGLAAVPAGIVSLYLNGLLVVDGQLGVMNRATLLASVGQTLAVLVLGAAGRLSVLAVVVLWVMVTSVPLLLQFPALSRKPGISRPAARLAREAVGLGLRYHIGMVAVFLVLRADIFMLDAMAGAAAVGIYSLAVMLCEATYLVTDPIAQVAVSTQVGTERRDAGYTARIARTNLLISSLLMVALVAVSPVAIPLLFGSPFGPSVLPISALALGTIAWSFQRPLGVFIVRENRPWLVTTASLSALCLNIVLNLVLIPRGGVVAAAFASTLTYVALCGFYLGWFILGTGAKASDLVPRYTDVRDPALAAIQHTRALIDARFSR